MVGFSFSSQARCSLMFDLVVIRFVGYKCARIRSGASVVVAADGG